METLRLILAVLAVTFAGWNILLIVSGKKLKLHLLEKMCLSYGLGLGVLSVEMFLFFFFNIKYGLKEILLPWVPIVIFNLVAGLKRTEPDNTYKDKISLLGIFLTAGITLEVLYAFFRALVRPLESYDSVATYAIKSKIFYLAGAIPQGYFNGLGLLFPHVDYPLNIPLSQTLMYIFMCSLNDQLVKAIFPLYFVAILGILYYGIRRFAGRTYALVFIFILASIPQFNNFATNAYIDVPLSYYYLTATLFLFYWFKEPDTIGFLYVSAIMTALAGWTKNEGLVYCAINVIVLAIYLFSSRKGLEKKYLLRGIQYIVLVAVILLPWLIIRKSAAVMNSDFGTLDAGRFDIVAQLRKVIPMFYEFQRQIFGPKKWNIFWIVFIIALVVYRKKLFTKYSRYITIPLVLVICGYIAAYLLTQITMPSLWSRLMLHFLPIAVYLLALLFKGEVIE